MLSENHASKDPHKPRKIERNLSECSPRTLWRGLRSANAKKVVAGLSRGLPNPENIGFGVTVSAIQQNLTIT